MNHEPNSPNPVGRVPSRGGNASQANAGSRDAGSGNPAYKGTEPGAVGRLPPTGDRGEPRPHRLRRLHRVWPDRDGNISYLLTPCVDGRGRVLDNEPTFKRLVAFLLDSPKRYHWFGRRFVIMPDHIHVIAHAGYDAIRLGQWIKALKAVVGGLEPREERPVGAPGLQTAPIVGTCGNVGRVPPPGVSPHEFTRIKRAWRWQAGFHDHKFRTPESEQRKWEYVCLNPVRAGLVKRPEEWPYGGEIFYDEAGGPKVVRGTPPLLETGILFVKNAGTEPPRGGTRTPRGGTRPTT